MWLDKPWPFANDIIEQHSKDHRLVGHLRFHMQLEAGKTLVPNNGSITSGWPTDCPLQCAPLRGSKLTSVGFDVGNLRVFWITWVGVFFKNGSDHLVIIENSWWVVDNPQSVIRTWPNSVIMPQSVSSLTNNSKLIECAHSCPHVICLGFVWNGKSHKIAEQWYENT